MNDIDHNPSWREDMVVNEVTVPHKTHDPLVVFLYLLMRDHMPVGKVHGLIEHVRASADKMGPDGSYVLSWGGLGVVADEMARVLGDRAVVPLPFVQDAPDDDAPETLAEGPSAPLGAPGEPDIGVPCADGSKCQGGGRAYAPETKCIYCAGR